MLSVLALLLVPLASGCVSGPQIRVDMDARANMKAYVWQGIAEGEVSEESQRNPGPAIDEVVSQMFSKFPLAPH